MDLGTETLTEDGVVFETGRPVEFDYVRGTTPSPNFGSRFQQDIEPAGRYMIHVDRRHWGDPLPGQERGTYRFQYPLVLAFTLDPDTMYGPTSWKARLRTAFKAKGKALSRKLAKAGYDGIVTVWLVNGKPSHTKEIVDLAMFKAKGNPAKGRDWAKRVYEEKLQTGSFANIGKQFPDDVKAARSVQSIALKKLYVKDARSSRRIEAPLPSWDRVFWTDVLAWANEQEALLNYPEEWQKAQAHIERFLKAGELDAIDLEFLQTKYHVVQPVLDRMHGEGLVKKVKGVYYPVKDNPSVAAKAAGSIVEVRCSQKWCVKSYLNGQGRRLATYSRIPKGEIQFNSPLVNDENQELCGGWTPDWVREYPGGEVAATVDRVVHGLKPLGFVFQIKQDVKAFTKLVASCKRHSQVMVAPNPNFVYAVVWEQDGTLDDIFNMELLAKDYSRWVSEEVGREILKYRLFKLSDFVKRWDIDHGIPMPITGLILGYPVENTISLMLGGRPNPISCGASVKDNPTHRLFKNAASKKAQFANPELETFVIANTPAAFEAMDPRMAEHPTCVVCGSPIKDVFVTNYGPMGGDCYATLSGNPETRRAYRKMLKMFDQVERFGSTQWSLWGQQIMWMRVDVENSSRKGMPLVWVRLHQYDSDSRREFDRTLGYVPEQPGVVEYFKGWAAEHGIPVRGKDYEDNPTLSPRDKKVIDAFVARKKASSPTLDSDRRRLHRSVGNEDVARWMGDRIVETSTESTRHDQTILRYLRKKAKTVSGYGQPTYAKGLRFFEGGDALYQGQWDGYIVAYVPQREAPVGRLDYSEYGGRYSIKMVEVDPAYRRYGVSTALFEHLLREHKITQADIDRGMQTEDGHQFRKAVDSYLPNPITRKLKPSKQDVPAPLKAAADGLLRWRGVEALGGKDVLAWVRRDGTPAFAFQGPALSIETRALNEEHMPINNLGSQADLSLQRSVGLDAKLERGNGWTGIQGGAGQTMSSDMVSLDEAADSIPDVLTAALGWKVNRPHFTMMPLEGEPYEGAPTPYYSAKKQKVFDGQAPGNIIKVEVFEDGKDVQKVGVDFCTVADRISETEGGVVGTLSGEDRFFLSHAFSVEGEQVDAKASAKLIKECGGLLYPSLALSDVPANNFGLCTLFFHLGLMVKHIKPYKKPSRGAWQVITYDTDAWTERTRNFAGDASAELYAQLTGQWEPRTYGHMMVLGPEAVEGTAGMGHDVKQVKTVANLRSALKAKRARWKRGMTEEQIEQASDTSSLRYPYLEVKINGILDLSSVPLATCPDFQKKAAVTFLKAIGFRGELIVVKVPEDIKRKLTTYVGGKAEAKATWDYAWLVRDAVIAWQEKRDTKVKKWNEMWIEHITDSGGELSRPKL